MDINELILKLSFELFDKSESISEIRKSNNHYLVVVNKGDGHPAFHRPYIVDENGDIIGKMKELDILEPDTEFDNAEVIYRA